MTKLQKRKRQGLRPKGAIAASGVLRTLFAEMDRRDLVMGDFARRIPCHQQSLCRWRYGGTSPMIVQVEAIAQLLGYRLVLEKIEGET